MQLRNQLVIGIICVVLGIFIAIQFKTVQANYLEGLIPSQRSTQLINELNKLKQERNTLNEAVLNLQTELESITSAAANDNSVIKSLQDQLDRFKLLSGFADAQGQGLIVTVDNPLEDYSESYGADIVNEFHYLLMLVNELHAAGAEAMAINEQRLISTSEIRSAGAYISINGTLHSPPFVIKAIGNKEVLDGALNQRFGIVSILRDRGYQVLVSRSDLIQVPRFSEVLNWQHARPVENE